MIEAVTPAGALLLVGVGVACGVINVIAGGGSFLSLPVLIFLGLPAGVANGTNRIGILTQNIVAVPSFRRYGIWERGAWLWAALPATVGSAVGVVLAFRTPDEAFKRLLAMLMVGVMFWSLWGPKPKESDEASWPPWALGAAFFVIGVYGGFVQAGVGFFMLSVTTMAGLDLVRGNGVKVLTALAFTLLAVVMFAAGGKIAWEHGLWLGLGTAVGGWLGARLTVLKGDRWVRMVVTGAAVVFAVKLWVT